MSKLDESVKAASRMCKGGLYHLVHSNRDTGETSAHLYRDQDKAIRAFIEYQAKGESVELKSMPMHQRDNPPCGYDS